MASIFLYHYYHVTVVSVFLIISATFSLARTFNDESFVNLKSLKREAEGLIRSFNLFPKHGMNIHVGEVSEYKFDNESRIVEKKIKFPLFWKQGNLSLTWVIMLAITGYSIPKMQAVLDLEPIKIALGVGDIEFVSCSFDVYEALIQDIMRNLEVGIPALLEDEIKFLVYAREYDLICNWLGNSKWLDAMKWSGQEKYLAASTVQFSVDGAEAGLQKGYGPLTFLKVNDAGHLVPMDQPKNSLEMLTRWMQGKSPLSQAGSL